MTGLPAGAAEIAAETDRVVSSPTDIEERVAELFTVLRRLMPFQAGTLHLLDPEHRGFTAVGGFGYPEAAAAYQRGAEHYREMELLGMDRDRPPMRVRDAPVPLAELVSWTTHFAPAGFREGIGVGLFAVGGRHVGILSLHTDSAEHPTDEVRDFLGLLAPVIAEGVDPMRSIVTLSRIVAGATAGVVLTRAGNTLELAGLPDHPVLRTGSPVLGAAAESLAEGEPHSAFLCPYSPGAGNRGFLRVSVLACPDHVPAYLRAVVLVSPSGDLHGLTRRELEILGMLIEGWSNQRIADTLVIAQRTVAAHIEHILAKLAAPSRTLAAVRAVRLGLYLPRSLTRSIR
ncbi:LuxR C-terminal-related transcriptional regulator [Plantactinospora sonchi]|uniref:LuxR C-terminal-related transcriptional regulator n=1 Tax=Plantactinospora sonchi TaxID=1544735 RepID=A0ABU7RNS0_9ACTN